MAKRHAYVLVLDPTTGIRRQLKTFRHPVLNITRDPVRGRCGKILWALQQGRLAHHCRHIHILRLADQPRAISEAWSPSGTREHGSDGAVKGEVEGIESRRRDGQLSCSCTSSLPVDLSIYARSAFIDFDINSRATHRSHW